MERTTQQERERGLAALDRIKNIKGNSGTGRGVSLIKVEQTERQPLDMSAFMGNPALAQAAKEIRAERNLAPIVAETTPDDSDAPPIDEDQDEERVGRRLLTQQVEAVGQIKNTNPEEYTGLQRDTVVVLQNLLPEDDIIGLAEKRAKEKGLIILL